MKFVKHSWKKEELIAYDNASIAEQDERGRLVAAEKKGIARGVVKGKQEGKLEEKEDVVARCWRKKMEIVEIAEISGLTVEEVKKIVEKLAK
ncbi:MAG: hypothetical protein AAGG68_25270 [Bacteroidota bacterium]